MVYQLCLGIWFVAKSHQIWKTLFDHKGEEINDNNFCIGCKRTGVPFSHVNEVLRELAEAGTFVLLIVPHFSYPEFQMTQGTLSGQWGHSPRRAACDKDRSSPWTQFKQKNINMDMGDWELYCKVTWLPRPFFEQCEMTLTWKHLYFYHCVQKICDQNIFPINLWIISFLYLCDWHFKKLKIFYLINIQTNPYSFHNLIFHHCFHLFSLHFQLQIQETMCNCR